MQEIRISSEAMEQLTAWFPDCKGVIDVDDAWDALNGYNISTGEICDLIMKLQSEGVKEFMPFCKMELRDHVSYMLLDTMSIERQLEEIDVDDLDFDPETGEDNEE